MYKIAVVGIKYVGLVAKKSFVEKRENIICANIGRLNLVTSCNIAKGR